MRMRGSSIFSRLLIAFLSVVIIVSGLLTAIFYVFSIQFAQRQVEEHLQQRLAGIDSSFHDQCSNPFTPQCFSSCRRSALLTALSLSKGCFH